eukprot:TRINITY_DN14620_c1_g4_i1.p2 TRINITY_DN14620_c1_g4~~TRINITY_DN14620_c1_g4_i1.p2  ORF type:complete len:104 (+),score=4.44 TRINITY_DN14620_c1_g4_i1:193-504(+)
MRRVYKQKQLTSIIPSVSTSCFTWGPVVRKQKTPLATWSFLYFLQLIDSEKKNFAGQNMMIVTPKIFRPSPDLRPILLFLVVPVTPTLRLELFSPIGGLLLNP